MFSKADWELNWALQVDVLLFTLEDDTDVALLSN